MNWDDPAERFFNPRPTVTTVPLPGASPVVVVDDVLLDPDGLVAWATRQEFYAPRGFPYPGVVVPAPTGLSARFAEFFATHVQQALDVHASLAHDLRLSMVTTPPAQLDPRQWQCHRDAVAPDASIAYVASVLYLFHDASLGGTSFYVPRQPPEVTEPLLRDSATLGAAAFTARHGLEPGYMDGSNAFFERVACVPAAWNRMIFYDAGFFHSGDIGKPDRLSADPAVGRLTANAFLNCRRDATAC